MEIGTILKKTRTIYDMPAKKLAAELKISPSYLSEIENNKKAPSIELLEKYANIFNMKLSSLILLSENYEDDKQKNKSEMYIQRKMIELINKYSSRSWGELMVRKVYPVDQSPFYKLHSKKKLANLLKISFPNLQRASKETYKQYNKFNIAKNEFEHRNVQAPSEDLKRIQKRILVLLQRIEIPDWVIGGVSGKSYITNAKEHQNSQYILKVDIKKFYDNCTRDRVYRLFKDVFKTSSDVAKVLTNITTLDSIPTGSPTSQLLAYLAYQDMFRSIYEISTSFGCTMTLYVDDLVFSNRNFFKYQRLTDLVRVELHKYSHNLKASKVKFYNTGTKGALVTGVIIQNGNLKIPNKLRIKIINSFNENKNKNNLKINSLKGQVYAAKRIEKEHFNGISTYIKES